MAVRNVVEWTPVLPLEVCKVCGGPFTGHRTVYCTEYCKRGRHNEGKIYGKARFKRMRREEKRDAATGFGVREVSGR